MASRIAYQIDGKRFIYFTTRLGLKLVSELDEATKKVKACEPKSIGYDATVVERGTIDGFPYAAGKNIWVPRDNIREEDLEYFED